MASDTPAASAFAVTGERFAAVGDEGTVRRAATSTCRVADLGGRTVIPGFIETHYHLSLFAMMRLQADCRTPPNRTLQDVLGRIGQKAEAVGPGNWVRGWGFDDTLIDVKRHLTKSDLDEAAPQNPVFVSHASGHLAYANSRALKIAGIGPPLARPVCMSRSTWPPSPPSFGGLPNRGLFTTSH